MMPARPFSAYLLVCLITAVGIQAAQRWPQLNPPPLMLAFAAGPLGGNETFEQFIDHSDPSLGTFFQRYWWNTTYWKGPGSPVMIFSAGESDASYYTGYLTNQTIMGLYAQEIGAALILFEHRYWGKSHPFQVLDTKNLSYHTLENAVADMVHFAETVRLPFDNSPSSNVPRAPWILVGGSYTGALAAWINKLSPGTFWASHASSAPVEAIYDYWSYFLPIQKGMPANCSADLSRIVDHIDNILDNGNKTEIQELKERFGLGDLTHDDDFTSAVQAPLGEWQSIQLYSNYSTFFQMCDTMEGVRAVDMSNEGENTFVSVEVPSTGIGLDKALPNFAAWFKAEFLPDACSQWPYDDWNYTGSVACFDTYNETSPIVTDLSADSPVGLRQWIWMTCNEPFAWWQTGAPKDLPSIVSRRVTTEYFQRQCSLLFPSQNGVTFGSNDGRTTERLNALTGGWDFVNTTRLIWVNGEFDPWRSASVSSELRPGGPLQFTPDVPVYLIPNAIHCNDLYTRSGRANKDLQVAREDMVKTMKRWVDGFYEEKGKAGGFFKPGKNDDKGA